MNTWSPVLTMASEHVWWYYRSSAVSEHMALFHTVLINYQLWFLPLYVQGMLVAGLLKEDAAPQQSWK